MSNMKICSSCGQEKDIGEFPKTGCKCKVCKAEKLREYRANNPDYREKRKKYRDDNREKIRKQKRENYRRNAGKIKKKNGDYYRINAERCRERQRKYQERVETANMEAWLAKCMKHAKAADKKYDREFDLTIGFLLDLYDRQDGRCAISNVPMKHERNNIFSASIDRIDRYKGHVVGNVQLVCQAINLAKREYDNQHISDFIMAASREINDVDVPDFGEHFSYPESTYDYTIPQKRMVMEKLRELCVEFIPPTYDECTLQKDLNRIDELTLEDYYCNKNWRSYKPESKSFAGKRLIWHYQRHLWDVRTQYKPLIKEVWGQGHIFEKALTNLVNGKTRISFDRIIRELIFAGAAIPSQMHPGFAKAILSYFRCKSGQVLYDPFAGWGARMLAARSLGMTYNACEMSRLTYNGLMEMPHGDINIRNISCFDDDVPDADVMLTSPPFGTEEYIGSHTNVNIGRIIEMTDHIPIRILHLSGYLGESISDGKEVIRINTKAQASSGNSEEYLVILR